MRPLGAVVFGWFGYRHGRARTMQVSVAMMALPTLLLGLLPSYSSVGMLAPVLLVVVRLVQGVSVGGEFSSSATYLVETAPEGRRGLTGSWADIGSMTGSLLGVGAAALVTSVVGAETLAAWAWRLPFLGVAVIGIAAILVRRDLHSSERFAAHHAARDETSPLMQAFTTNRRETLLAVAFALLAVPIGSGPALFVEMFPESDRLSGYSVAFNVGLGVVGGATPMIATALIAVTGVATIPGLYLAAGLVAVLALAATPDGSRVPLR